MSAWDALIRKSDLREVEVRASDTPDRALADGEVLLAVERFSLTANNITYGAMGDAFGYWKFFPAPDGQGRIPVWGFATVVKSNAPDVAEGLRLFGYLPMSTHFTMRLAKGRHGYVDTAPHRAELPPTYNAYAEAPADALDDHRALLRPLLMTSFLLDDFLGEDAALTTLVLSSASSKTAMGLAWFARRRGLTVIGLSSPANLEHLAALGLYDCILPYDEAGELKTGGSTAYVDFAGNRAVTATVHTALGDSLTRSLIVGGTHWEADRAAGQLAGVQPVLFFAPDQIRKRSAEWGPQAVTARFDQGLADFVAANPWLTLVQHRGAEGLKTAYSDAIEGRARPQDGHIIRPA
jgi:NADPH:quinone reductase-like Zn-dependent oxidoreductase